MGYLDVNWRIKREQNKNDIDIIWVIILKNLNKQA